MGVVVGKPGVALAKRSGNQTYATRTADTATRDSVYNGASHSVPHGARHEQDQSANREKAHLVSSRVIAVSFKHRVHSTEPNAPAGNRTHARIAHDPAYNSANPKNARSVRTRL